MSRNAYSPYKHLYTCMMFKKKSGHVPGILNSFQTDKEVNAYNLHYLCHLSVNVNIDELRVKTFVWSCYIYRFIMRNWMYKQTLFRPYITTEFGPTIYRTSLGNQPIICTNQPKKPARCQSGRGNYTTISSNQSRKPNVWPQMVRTRLLTAFLLFVLFANLGPIRES